MFENKTITFKEVEEYHRGLMMLTTAVESSEKGVGLDLTYKLIKGLKKIEEQIDSINKARTKLYEVYGTLDDKGALTPHKGKEDILEPLNKDIKEFLAKEDEFTLIKDKIKVEDIKHLVLKPSFLIIWDKYLEGLEKYE